MNSLLSPFDVVVKSLDIDRETILLDYTLRELKKEFVPAVNIEEVLPGTFLNIAVTAEIEAKYEIELTARMHVTEGGLETEASAIERIRLDRGQEWSDEIRKSIEEWKSAIVDLIRRIINTMLIY